MPRNVESPTGQLLHDIFLVDLENNINNQDVENYMDLEPVTFPPEFPIVEALNELQIAGKTHGVVMQNSKPVLKASLVSWNAFLCIALCIDDSAVNSSRDT